MINCTNQRHAICDPQSTCERSPYPWRLARTAGLKATVDYAEWNGEEWPRDANDQRGAAGSREECSPWGWSCMRWELGFTWPGTEEGREGRQEASVCFLFAHAWGNQDGAPDGSSAPLLRYVHVESAPIVASPATAFSWRSTFSCVESGTLFRPDNYNDNHTTKITVTSVISHFDICVILQKSNPFEISHFWTMW